MRNFWSIPALMILLTACSLPESKTVSVETNDQDSIVKESVFGETDTTFQVNSRTFVDSGYEKRADGNDWIAVKIDSIAPDTITVKVFSRADIKKPTCNFYSKAFELEKGIYKSVNTDPVVMFTLEEDVLHVGGISEEENQKLMFYCSGGGNLVGDYQLLTAPIDTIRTDTIQ